jgi:hypothetical protein
VLNETGQVITWVTSRDVNLGILHGVTATESWSPFYLDFLLPIQQARSESHHGVFLTVSSLLI